MVNKIQEKLLKRKKEGTFRSLTFFDDSKIDFISNDYLGLAKEKISLNNVQTGASGSRLISGNYKEIQELEDFIANFHKGRAALLFPSGLQANTSIFPTIATKNDVIFFDEKIHFSLKQSIRLSFAKKVSFKHNDFDDLAKKLSNIKGENKFVVVETIYSMDGDVPDFEKLLFLKYKYDLNLIVDEAHSVGLFGDKGEGLLVEKQFYKDILIRIYTYGKAFGFQGAALVFNDKILKDFFVNFSYNFIYTTGLTPVFVNVLRRQYSKVAESYEKRYKLFNLINVFKEEFKSSELKIIGDGPIFGLIINKISVLNSLTQKLKNSNILVKPIFYPTVRKGEERFRIVLHSYNYVEEIKLLKRILTINR